METAGEIDSTRWNDVNTTTQFQNWLNGYSGADFSEDFANPLGIGQSFRLCGKLNAICPPPDCSSFTPPYADGTGWKYCVVLSVSNLNNVSISLFSDD